MTKETFEQDMKDAVSSLLEIARTSCWNIISDNCVYIISEIKDSHENSHQQRITRNKINKKKIPQSFEEMIEQMKSIYSIIYDVNFFVYKSEKHRTIIDVRYYPKTNFDKDYLEEVKDKTPMIYCKIPIPPYISNFNKNKQEKFDVNWELGGIRNQWKMFWWRRRMRR